MWIILEGADGAGKSTLADNIAEKLRRTPLPVIQTHLGPPKRPESALQECLDYPYSEYTVSREHLVSDRWSWGCPVYGPIYRPDSNHDGFGDFGIGGFRYLELFAISRGAYIVLVDAEPQVLRDRLAARGDDYVDVNDLEKIVEKYRTMTVESKAFGDLVPAGSSRDAIDAVASEIITGASVRERQADLLSWWPQYVGPINPRVVYNATLDESVKLLEQMDDGWRHVGFVDPAKTSKRQRQRLYSALGSPVVALESVAKAASV